MKTVCLWLLLIIVGIAIGAALALSAPKFHIPPACAEIRIVDKSLLAWKERDFAAFKRATSQCAVRYKNSPCLKKFIRREMGRYWAICGSPE